MILDRSSLFSFFLSGESSPFPFLPSLPFYLETGKKQVLIIKEPTSVLPFLSGSGPDAEVRPSLSFPFLPFFSFPFGGLGTYIDGKETYSFFFLPSFWDSTKTALVVFAYPLLPPLSRPNAMMTPFFFFLLPRLGVQWTSVRRKMNLPPPPPFPSFFFYMDVMV